MTKTAGWCIGVLAAAALSACSSSHDDAIQLCAKLSTCATMSGSGSLGQVCQLLTLLDENVSSSQATSTRVAAPLLDCVRRASDCNSAKACAQATPDQAAVCAGANNVDKCSGNVVVQCDGTATPPISNCGAVGLVCGANQTSATCGTASCDPMTSAPSCDGALATTCDPGGNVLVVRDCRYNTHYTCTSTNGGPQTCQAKVGDACAIVDGEASCVGTGDACDEKTFVNSCDGSTIVSCAGGKIGRRNCASLDSSLTCRLDPSGAATCQPSAQECDGKAPETCDGGIATICYLGKITKIDCKAYGLSGCTTLPGENSGATVARCTP